MKPYASFGIVFVAVVWLATGAMGQSVYRCGNAYSEKPCTDGVAVNVQDARTNSQRREADAATRRDIAATKALDQAKQKELKQSKKSNDELNKSGNRTTSNQANTANAPANRSEGDSRENGTSTSQARKKKDSEYFTARTVATKPASKASARK